MPVTRVIKYLCVNMWRLTSVVVIGVNAFDPLQCLQVERWRRTVFEVIRFNGCHQNDEVLGSEVVKVLKWLDKLPGTSIICLR